MRDERGRWCPWFCKSVSPTLTQFADSHKPAFGSSSFFFATGLWTLLLALLGSPLFPALLDSFTGLLVRITFSRVVVKVRSVLRSQSLVCRPDFSKALSATAPLLRFSDGTGDPSSRTKGFSYSLVRKDAALDGPAPPAFILRRSLVDAARVWNDAI